MNDLIIKTKNPRQAKTQRGPHGPPPSHPGHAPGPTHQLLAGSEMNSQAGPSRDNDAKGAASLGQGHAIHVAPHVAESTRAEGNALRQAQLLRKAPSPRVRGVHGEVGPVQIRWDSEAMEAVEFGSRQSSV